MVARRQSTKLYQVEREVPMQALVDRAVASEPPYSASTQSLPIEPPSSGQSAVERAAWLNEGTLYIVILLCSLSLWAATWAVTVSLNFPPL
jgi:hypothetical protein